MDLENEADQHQGAVVTTETNSLGIKLIVEDKAVNNNSTPKIGEPAKPKHDASINGKLNSTKHHKNRKPKTEAKSKDANKDVIQGNPILCTLCNIKQPFKLYPDVLSHLHGKKHRAAAWKLLYLNSQTSVTFKSKSMY